MNSFSPRILRRCLLPALALLAAASAPAQTIITSAPYTITQAGSYRVGANLAASTTASVIEIHAPNVELDLGGYTLAAPATSSGASIILVAAVSNVTIRNGTVSGGAYGILFDAGTNSANHLVENVRLAGCSIVGILFNGNAPGSVIRNNLVVGTGAGNTSNETFGIITRGGVLIQDNAVGKISAPGTRVGILAVTGDFVVGNTVNECGVGIYGGKCLNNLTTGCATPFQETNNVNGNN